MKTFTIDTDRLGPVMVRQAPTPRLNDQGQPQVDDNGQVVHLGRVVLPGVQTSTYGTPSPRQCRLKVTGHMPADITDGAVVTFAGKVNLTSWYLRGARGRDAKSEVTLSPERIELAVGQLPRFDGLVPVHGPADPFVLMQWRGRQDNPGFEVACIVPASVIDESGTVNVFVDQQPADGLEGRPVRFDNLRVALVVPESEDAGRSNKAQFIVHADRLVPAEPAVAGAGSRRRSEPVAAEQNSPDEG